MLVTLCTYVKTGYTNLNVSLNGHKMSLQRVLFTWTVSNIDNVILHYNLYSSAVYTKNQKNKTSNQFKTDPLLKLITLCILFLLGFMYYRFLSKTNLFEMHHTYSFFSVSHVQLKYPYC